MGTVGRLMFLLRLKGIHLVVMMTLFCLASKWPSLFRDILIEGVMTLCPLRVFP